MTLKGPPPGTMIGGRYRVIRKLGSGGMGTVHLGRTEGPGGFEKLVALKLLHEHLSEDRTAMDAFLAEARLCAQLNHPNIAQIYDLGGSDEGGYYMAMEFVSGHDLRTVMCAAAERESALPIEHVVLMISRLCLGLDYAHKLKDSQGRPLKLVHRDVTPANCLLSFQGELKLIDFGIARIATEAGRTRAGVVKGKAAYMSPEQARGLPLDRRSDIFSVGSMLYELLAGPRPFDGDDDLATLRNIIAGKYKPLRELDPTIPESLEKIVNKCLARDPTDRYQWASEVHDSLAKFLMEQGIFLSNFDLQRLLEDLFPGEGGDPALADKKGEPQTSETGQRPEVTADSGPTATPEPAPVMTTERVPDLELQMARAFMANEAAKKAEKNTTPERKPAAARSTQFRKLEKNVADRLSAEYRERKSLRFQEEVEDAKQTLSASGPNKRRKTITAAWTTRRMVTVGVVGGVIVIAVLLLADRLLLNRAPEPLPRPAAHADTNR